MLSWISSRTSLWFFFFKQKTAYEIVMSLEFRRVLFRSKQYAEAEKGLRALAEKKDGTRLEPALARLALADLHRRQGQVEKAVEEYRALAGDSGLPLPRDYALMSLAGTLEDAKRLAEAVAAYKRLTEEFPASVYAGEARRKADYLQTAAQ